MLRYKMALILLVTAVAVILIAPPQKKIRLGLDLKGGIYLLCRVVTDDAISADLDDIEMRITQGLEEKELVVRTPESTEPGNTRDGATYRIGPQKQTAGGGATHCR